MDHLKIYVFNVGAGQCILIVPIDQPKQALLVDCGGDESLSPIKYLSKLLPMDCGKPILGCLAITHFDHDHISYLPELRKSAWINNVLIPKNVTAAQLKSKKEDTEALQAVYYLMKHYDNPNHFFSPNFMLYSVHLEQTDLDDFSFNDLSQIIFVKYGKTTICIPGDLESTGWTKLLETKEIGHYLSSTNILVASHHGRENGYHPSIFSYCNPEVIIISDKNICHDTQELMGQRYSTHVTKAGIIFNGNRRKVLTTRADGHLLLKAFHDGSIS